MPSGATLSLNLIGNNPNMSYVFASGFTVGSAGACKWTSARTCSCMRILGLPDELDDEGTVTFSTGVDQDDCGL